MIEPTEQDCSALSHISELLSAHGYDGLGKVVEVVLNLAMQLEREQYLRAKPYERCQERRGHANGFKPKTLKSRLGKLELLVPQTRDGFYPSSLEKGLRSEKALKLALAEMYIQGVSTRNVAKITEQLCGFRVTSDQVSRAAKELDEILDQWRTRPLACYPFVYLDARYEKAREGGAVRDVAVLIAKGVRPDGRREIIGVSVAISEAEVHWREFLKSLVARGLHGAKLIVSDDHSGLKAARKSVLPSVPWQRCQFHLQQNAQAYIRKQSERSKVGQQLRAVFNAPNHDEANRHLSMLIDGYAKSHPRLSTWLEGNIEQGLTVFNFDNELLRKKLRTTNPLERVNKEIKRRTRVATIFPNVDSCLRLVSAVLMETSEEWEHGKRYMCLDE